MLRAPSSSSSFHTTCSPKSPKKKPPFSCAAHVPDTFAHELVFEPVHKRKLTERQLLEAVRRNFAVAATLREKRNEFVSSMLAQEAAALKSASVHPKPIDASERQRSGDRMHAAAMLYRNRRDALKAQADETRFAAQLSASTPRIAASKLRAAFERMHRDAEIHEHRRENLRKRMYPPPMLHRISQEELEESIDRMHNVADAPSRSRDVLMEETTPLTVRARPAATWRT